MLNIIKEYEFCSTGCYEAIEVLDVLKVAFDENDVEYLKSFVQENLESQQTTHFTFESGNKCTNANLASVVKIGIALRRLTQQHQ
jgi:hypothetical protein